MKGGHDVRKLKFKGKFMPKFEIFKNILANDGIVNCLYLKDMADKFSRKDLDKLTDFVKVYKAKALSYLKYSNNELTGSISKVLSDTEKEELISNHSFITYNSVGKEFEENNYDIELVKVSTFKEAIDYLTK